MYDAAFAELAERAIWTVAHSGSAGYRHAGDWIVFASASPVQGDPGTGSVSSDFDPESDVGVPEGVLFLNIAPGTFGDDSLLKGTIPTAVKSTLLFDILADPLAPALGTRIYPGRIGEPNIPQDQLDRHAAYPITWGSTGPPAQLSACRVEVWQGRGPSGAFKRVGGPAFSYQPGATLASLGAWQFSIDASVAPPQLLVGLPPLQPAIDRCYVVRFGDDVRWGSLSFGGAGLYELDNHLHELQQ
jgi:hypothetical protein